MIGLIKGVIGLFGSNKSTGAVLETAADGLYNGIDKLIYTQEERAEALQGARTVFLKFAKVAYDQNSIRSITRRWLAFMVVGPTILFYMLAAVSHGVGTFATVPAATEYAVFMFEMAGELIPWAGGVLVFYFGPHIIGAKKEQ